MDFLQQLSSTFFGALFAFGVSMLVFHLTEKAKGDKNRRNLLKNLIGDLDYNIKIIEDIILPEFTSIKRSINEGGTNIVFMAKVTLADVFRYFIECAYRNGLINELLDTSERAELQCALKFCSLISDTLIQDTLTRLFNGEDAKTTMGTIKIYEDDSKKYLDIFKSIRTKVEKQLSM